VNGDRRRFDVVMRGYERTSVDDYMQRSVDEAARLQRELAECERRRALAEQHATATESENRTLRSEQIAAPSAPEEGFGYRAEKLLRLAEQEAADVRGSAAREASAMLEQVRAESEQHRCEVEQTLIARSSLLDQQATQRSVELQEREQQATAQLAAAQAEIEAMHETAGRTAEHNRQRAEAEAAALRARAEHDARRLREQAEQEVTRLGTLRDGARSEIARLAELLQGGLGEATPGRSGPPFPNGRAADRGSPGAEHTGRAEGATAGAASAPASER